MGVFRTSLLACSLAFAGAWAQPPARPTRARPFEIGTNNLFEALRQMAAHRELDLVVDPDVPNRKSIYAFKHTTWEKALESLANSHGLAWEVRDRILRVSLANRTPGEAGAPAWRAAGSRMISLTFRPSAEGEPLLSVNVVRAGRGEVLEALARLERIAKAKPDKRSFTATWTLRPVKEGVREEMETFTLEDISPSGLRALYP